MQSGAWHISVILGGLLLIAVQVNALQTETKGRLSADTIRISGTEVELDEIRVSAFHSGNYYREVPGTIEVLDLRGRLLATSYHLAEQLNLLPGINMQSGALNTNRLVIRGIGSRSPYSSTKIRAYLGAIPLTNGAGETAVEDLDLSTVASVEVIKGPASGFYGSGLGGTLLFLPQKESGGYIRQSVSVGAFNTQSV